MLRLQICGTVTAVRSGGWKSRGGWHWDSMSSNVHVGWDVVQLFTSPGWDLYSGASWAPSVHPEPILCTLSLFCHLPHPGCPSCLLCTQRALGHGAVMCKWQLLPGITAFHSEGTRKPRYFCRDGGQGAMEGVPRALFDAEWHQQAHISIQHSKERFCSQFYSWCPDAHYCSPCGVCSWSQRAEENFKWIPAICIKSSLLLMLFWGFFFFFLFFNFSRKELWPNNSEQQKNSRFLFLHSFRRERGSAALQWGAAALQCRSKGSKGIPGEQKHSLLRLWANFMSVLVPMCLSLWRGDLVHHSLQSFVCEWFLLSCESFSKRKLLLPCFSVHIPRGVVLLQGWYFYMLQPQQYGACFHLICIL